MNDIELDEVLNAWTAPSVPASLRAGVVAGFGAGKERRFGDWWTRPLWTRGLAAALVGAALLFLVKTAVPQTLPVVHPPYTVESEFLRYQGNGTAVVMMDATSYAEDGKETILSRSIPGNPLETLAARTLDAASQFARPLLLRMAGVSDAQMAMRRSAVGVITGCANQSCLLGLGSYSFPKAAGNPAMGCVEGAAVDRATILGYPTAAARIVLGNGWRITAWMAPDLGCFAMKVTTDERLADGTFRLLSGRRAVRVTLNP